jgi:hypothetical protein
MKIMAHRRLKLLSHYPKGTAGTGRKRGRGGRKILLKNFGKNFLKILGSLPRRSA